MRRWPSTARRGKPARACGSALTRCAARSPDWAGGEKKTLVASEQNQVARAAWREANAELKAENLVVLDETRATTTLTRRSTRVPGGQRARGSAPRNQGTGTTLIAALTTSGMTAAMTLPGALDTAAFLVFLEEILGPTLRPGQVVVLDNLSVHLSVHKVPAAEKVIAAAGCRLLFLPPYSPDFSPIENAFAQVKAFLRSVGVRGQEALEQAISTALDRVTAADANAYFRHTGYRLTAQHTCEVL